MDGITPSANLYVKNFPISWGPARLREYFGQFGVILECRVLPVTGVAPGASALVRMASAADATRAIKALHGRSPPGT